MKQKRIGIITIPDYNNYGNRLQNYAVKRFFESMGYQVDSLEMNDIVFPKYRARKIKLLLNKTGCGFVVRMMECLRKGRYKAARTRKFVRFAKKYLSVKYFPYYSQATIEKIIRTYDYIVLGSDQIWHPTINKTPNLFFAKFMPRERVLYFSPSFGEITIPEAYELVLKEGLQDHQHITVREETGAKIIHNLLGYDVTVLPDPTICISPEEWRTIATSPKKLPKKPYVLKCFLDGVLQESQDFMDSICGDKVVFEIANPKMPKGYVTGPDEFLGSIMNAEFVLTDSFHAVIFCLMFHKPFVVFPRLYKRGEQRTRDSRIDGLLQKIGMPERKYVGNPIDIFGCTFDLCEEVFASERALAKAFFEQIM